MSEGREYPVCLVNLPHAIPEIFDMLVFYKMAGGCRPEVDNDVISCQMVEGVEIVHLLNFGDPSSNRLGAIRIADFVTTTATTVYAYYPINAQPKGSGVNKNLFFTQQVNAVFVYYLTRWQHYSFDITLEIMVPKARLL